MLLRQLQYFCAVCEEGSFTRAAEKSYVSQSAISQQIKALENDLGYALIKREGRSFSLTPAGEHFYHKGADILLQLENLTYEGEGIANGYATSLSVGYLNLYDGWEFQAAVAAFTTRHPRIPVHAHSGSHDTLYHLLMSGAAELVFNDRRRSLSEKCVNRFLMTCYTSVEVSEASPVAWATELYPSDLADLPCVIVAAPDQEDVERDYYANVLNFRSEFLFARSREEALMMVAGNRGYSPVETRVQQGRTGSIIRRIPLCNDEGQITHDYYAFYLKEHETPLVQEFADILVGVLEEGGLDA